MKSLVSVTLCFLLTINLFAQKNSISEIRIAYYNADQFFDTEDQSYEADDLFTASGSRFWGEKRYNEKMAATITLLEESFEGDLPEILIIGEVESRKTLDLLISRGKLKRQNYRVEFISNNSGLGAAILYTAEAVKKIGVEDITPGAYSADGTTLVSKLTMTLADDLVYYLYLNNWPGRSMATGGPEADRIMCAVAIRKDLDNILNFEQGARAIICGTFNDEPTNRSILSVLNASNKRHNLFYRDLYNPFYDLHNIDNLGTMLVNGEWQMYDFITLTPSVLSTGEGFSADFGSAQIHSMQGLQPVPTYRGDEYVGGAGGHLPVSITLEQRIDK